MTKQYYYHSKLIFTTFDLNKHMKNAMAEAKRHYEHKEFKVLDSKIISFTFVHQELSVLIDCIID